MTKENSIYVDSLISNYKKKNVWIECKECECLFESYSKTKMRCPTCWIANRAELSKIREQVKKEKAEVKKIKVKKANKLPKKCIGCKKPVLNNRSTYCSVDCRIKNTTGYV